MHMHHTVEVIVACILHRARWTAGAGIGKDDIDAAEGLGALLNRGLDVGGLENVAAGGNDAAVRVFAKRGKALFVDIGGNDTSALARDQARGRGADGAPPVCPSRAAPISKS